MSLTNLYTFIQFNKAMKDIGFKNITVFEKTKEIVPSAKRFNRICRIMYPFIMVATKICIIPKIIITGCIAGIVQYEALQLELAGYGIMYGEK